METIDKVSTIAALQIAEFPDIYWAAIVYNEGDDYKVKHDELKRFLEGVKNVRKFCQLDEIEGSRKCALDGERTALFYRKVIDEHGKQREPNYLSKEKQQIYNYLDTGEALSAVSLVKRLYKKDESKFPSTAQIALMNVLNKQFKETYDKYFIGDVDYQLFYEENLNEKNLKKQGIVIKNRYSMEDIKKSFLNITKDKLSKYYAILLFDGDSFGNLWSGEKLKEGISLLEFQKILAEKLNDFSKTAKSCLDTPKGKAVYAGGDDFLGFVNLSYLFDVIKLLREKFEEIVFLPLKNQLCDGEQITFSAGVIVAHYKAPLVEVLTKARTVEKEAKVQFEDTGKDAFGISVMKSSGEINEAYLKFYPENTTGSSVLIEKSITLIKQVIEALQHKNGFSNTFIRSFEQEMRKVMDEKGRTSINSEAISAELMRLLKRSSKQNGNEKEDSVKKFHLVVNSLRQVSGKTSNFISLLSICDFIKRETSKTE
jgi:CRISPR-associated protein Cmr2